MKTIISIVAFAGCCFFLTSDLSAQERTAKKYDNPLWKRIVYIDYHSGKTSRAREIVREYYQKASQKAGTPGPSMVLRMETGQYDVIAIWDMKEGVEELNWDVSPNNVKWWKAMVEIAGGEEKARAIQSEYQSLVRSAKSELCRVD